MDDDEPRCPECNSEGRWHNLLRRWYCQLCEKAFGE